MGEIFMLWRDETNNLFEEFIKRQAFERVVKNKEQPGDV
jgi:phage head maturation protease